MTEISVEIKTSAETIFDLMKPITFRHDFCKHVTHSNHANELSKIHKIHSF